MDKNIKRMMGLDVEVPQIKLRQIEHLVPYYRNSRTHSPAQIEMLGRLMLEFGWTNTVLIDDMGIVAGHGRCMAAEALYKRGEQIKFPNGSAIPIGMVPTLDVSGWSAAQRKAYIIADNQSALMGSGWDEEVLRLELQELKESDFDLSLTAFEEDQLDQLLADVLDAPEIPADRDPDDAPAAPDQPVSVLGDVWICGAHRVMCGSSLSVDDWDTLMQGELADICWTDPPYNVDLGRRNKILDDNDGGVRGKKGSIANDKMGAKEFNAFLTEAFTSLFVNMKPGAPIYISHSDHETINFCSAFEAAGFHRQSILIWRKNTMVLGKKDWQTIHEPIIYGYKKGSAHRWYGGRKNTSVIDLGDGSPFVRMEDGRYQIKVGDSVLVVSADATVEEHPSSIMYEAKPAKSGLHPTQKPVALVERMLRQSARAGDVVIDAFGGSGTTLLAADRLGMSARLMELEPKFVDVIVRRWEMYTGRRAVHAQSGALFPGGEDAATETKPSKPSTSLFDGPDLF